MITHIVNENFKSYAGVQTLGPFHKVLGYMLHSETYLSRISFRPTFVSGLDKCLVYTG